MEDGKPLAEVERIGVSLVDYVDMVLTRAEWGSPRAARLLAPHYRAYVLRAVTTGLLRPGSVPTGSDLYAILTYTRGLWELEGSAINSTAEAKSALVQAALGAVDRWRAAGGRDLPRPQEISYHQLRYAEAQIAHDEGDLPRAKALFERNLSTEPVVADLDAAGILRRCYAKSLLRWGACAAEQMARDGKIPDFEQRMKDAAESWILVCKPENMMHGLAALMAENPAQVATASLGDLFVAVQDAERETVARFAAFTHTTLNMPVLELMADFLGAVWDGLQPHDGSTVTRGNAADLTAGDRSEDGQQGATRDTQALVNQLSGVLTSAGRRRRRNDDTHHPYLNMLRDGYHSAEADLREMAGDNRGAAQAMQAEFAREALSSTQNTGWQHLSRMHINMYRLAVESTPPDYRAALAHLEEDWNQHRGVGMPKMQECYAHLRFATCYHALGQIADAARSVIKVYQVADGLNPGDVPTGNVAGVQEWLCEQIVGMEALRVFLRRRAVLFNTPQAAGLGLRERLRMRTIMGMATDIVEERRKYRETARDMKGMLGELRELMVERNEDGVVAQIDETMQGWD